MNRETQAPEVGSAVKDRVIGEDPSFESRVKEEFNLNEKYFLLMRKWHLMSGGLALEPDVRSLMENSINALPRGSVFLEAGSGEGSITNWFASRFDGLKFFGVDISAIGVNLSKENAPSNSHFCVADLKKLPFSGPRFDLILSNSVLEHVVGWDESLRDAGRVLKKGGRLIVRVGNGGRRGTRGIKALIKYLLRLNKVQPAKPSFKLREESFVDAESNFDVQDIPSDILLSKMRKAGFRIVKFSTGTEDWKESPHFHLRLASILNFWPFSHMGPTTLVLAEKSRNV